MYSVPRTHACLMLTTPIGGHVPKVACKPLHVCVGLSLACMSGSPLHSLNGQTTVQEKTCTNEGFKYTESFLQATARSNRKQRTDASSLSSTVSSESRSP